MSLLDYWEPLREAGLFGGKTLDKESMRRLADRRRRDPRGRFADELGRVPKGASFKVGNVHVKRNAGGFTITRVHSGGAKETQTARSRDEALRKSLDASARDKHPEALGGRSTFRGLKDFEAQGEHRPPSHEDLEKDPQGILGKGQWDAHRANVKRLAAGDFADTQRLHKPGGRVNEEGEYVGGEYTPERRELHRQIVERHLRGHVRQDQPEILFMGGGGASGKSTMLRSGMVAAPGDSVLVNPDVVKSMLPEYDQSIKEGRDEAAVWSHEESSDVAKLIHQTALYLGLNITVDKTKIKPEDVRAARERGYKPSGAVATVPIPLALERAKIRAEKTGRKIHEAELIKAHQTAARDFERWAEESRMRIVLMETDKGRVIAKAAGGRVRPTDPEEYAVFRSRAERPGA
jgi:predicted ABC-type ATPase